MSIKIVDNVEKFAGNEGFELKDWQKRNLRQIEREVSRNPEISQDEVMDKIRNELKKEGYFLKNQGRRDLEKMLF